MEHPLIAASLRSRSDYELIKGYIDVRQKTYSKPFQVVMSKIGDYYARDGNAEAVVPEVLLTQIVESIRNEKHVATFSDLINESLANTSSDSNVRAAILLAKQQEVGDRLSIAITSGMSEENLDALLEEYSQLRQLTSLDDLTEQGLEVYEGINLSDLVAVEYDPDSLIKLYPQSLNDRLDGGAKRGHHIVVFARPEAGKTAFCVNLTAGIARQGFKVLYFINEDRPQDIILRLVSNLSGLTKYQIQQEPSRAQELAINHGFSNIIVVSCSPGTPAQIEEYIEKYQPDAIIIDQLRNLKVRADNRVNQLEYAATAARTIGKKWNVLVVSVTQAGDSAEGKAVLDMGDVDFSNTGIPSQADVMVGIGYDATMDAEGLRTLSLPKNKISGVHESWPVRLTPQLSRVTSV